MQEQVDLRRCQPAQSRRRHGSVLGRARIKPAVDLALQLQLQLLLGFQPERAAPLQSGFLMADDPPVGVAEMVGAHGVTATHPAGNVGKAYRREGVGQYVVFYVGRESYKI